MYLGDLAALVASDVVGHHRGPTSQHAERDSQGADGRLPDLCTGLTYILEADVYFHDHADIY